MNARIVAAMQGKGETHTNKKGGRWRRGLLFDPCVRLSDLGDGQRFMVE
jgi:hypothetical protein